MYKLRYDPGRGGGGLNSFSPLLHVHVLYPASNFTLVQSSVFFCLITTPNNLCRRSRRRTSSFLLPLQLIRKSRPLPIILGLLLPHLPNHRTLCTNPLAILVKHKRNRNEHHLHQAQQRSRPLRREFGIHARSCEGQRSAKDGPHHGIARQRTGGVVSIRAGEVVGAVNEAQRVAHTERDSKGDGDGVVDAGGQTGPGEDELADGGENGANGHDAGAGFGGDTAGFGVLGMRVYDFAPDGFHEDGDEGADADADEGEARITGGPATIV